MTGPGRPSTGLRVDVRIPADVLAALDGEAVELGWTRAEMVRYVLAEYVQDMVAPRAVGAPDA